MIREEGQMKMLGVDESGSILLLLLIQVLIFIKDSNLNSVTQTLKSFKDKSIKKKGKDNLIRNYGIGAQIIKDLKIKKMILITLSLIHI